MIPIHELLNRIRWDKEFAKGDFEIGYYDRVEDKIIVVALSDVYFGEDHDRFFNLLDENGETHHIPLHRVRRVYKDGELIWSRDPLPGEAEKQRQ